MLSKSSIYNIVNSKEREQAIDREEALECYLQHVSVGDPDECWECNGTPSGEGYTTIRVGGYKFYAHRLAFFLFNGWWPRPNANHSCRGNRRCANPRHIYEGTQKQNMEDKILHGTSPVGERNPGSVLNDDLVIEFRDRYRRGGVTMPDLEREVGIDSRVIGAALTGKTWKHLPGALSREEILEIERENAIKRAACPPPGGRDKLNDGRVEWIRARYAAGNTTKPWMAELLGVTPQCIAIILRGGTWKHCLDLEQIALPWAREWSHDGSLFLGNAVEKLGL